MKKQILAVAFTMAVMPLLAQVSCGNHFPVFSPDGNYLYFSTDRDGQFEIYRTTPDGSEITRITQNAVDEVYPQFSPDGTKIIFQGGFYGSGAEIYIMNADGSSLEKLTDNTGHDGFPSFSPDGTKILFEAWDDSQYPEIFTMNTDGSNRTQLTNLPGADWQCNPVYTPDGSHIYFSKGFNADNHFVMMDLDGTNWVDITEPNVFGYAEGGLTFNADGSKIVFYTSEWGGYNGRMEIVMANADGSDWQRLTNTEANDIYNITPLFNPADALIYFVSNRNEGQYHIFNMELDGDNVVQVTNCSPAGMFDKGSGGMQAACIPNPVITSGFIRVSIEKPDQASATFYNATGNKANVKHTLTRDGVVIEREGMASGLYFFEIYGGPDRIGYGKILFQ